MMSGVSSGRGGSLRREVWNPRQCEAIPYQNERQRSVCCASQLPCANQRLDVLGRLDLVIFLAGRVSRFR